MKKQFILFVFLVVFGSLHKIYGQQANQPLLEKEYNYSSFSNSRVLITSELEKNSSAYAKSHEEYGILPFNAGCDDCSEIIDKRTANTRYYVGNNPTERAVYAQTTLNDLHYKNANGDWVTIDYRLHPTSTENVYSAAKQDQPTSINFNTNATSIQLTEEFVLEFNKGWQLSGSNSPESAQLMHPLSHVVGNDGAILYNAWNGIDIRHTFSKGKIKTDFILKNLNAIDASSEYSIFKETITLPEGFSIIRDIYVGEESANGRWIGDLILVDAFGNEYARFERIYTYMEQPVDEEMAALNLIGEYNVEQVGNQAILYLYLDNNWLTNPDRTFPIIIDPTVSGTPSSIAGTPLGSRYWPEFCIHTMNVSTPANATLTTANVSLDVDTKNGGCSPSGNCQKNYTVVYISTSCGVDPIGAPGIIYTCVGGGTCLASGHLVLPTTSMPHLVEGCFTPSCASFTIPFNVHLQRLACVNTDPLCDVPCVQLDDFDVTIKGKTVEATATAAGGTSYTVLDCTDQSDWLTADPDIYGVPDYTYSWSPIGSTDASVYVTFPLGVTVYTLTITDACGNVATDNVTVTNNCLLLPLNLNAFSGYFESGYNYLSWISNAENTDYFIIERSLNGKDFAEVGKISNQTTPGSLEYAFNDPSPSVSTVYYRLKQIKADLQAYYSDVIAIKTAFSSPNSITSTQFDPATGLLALEASVTSGSVSQLNIFDLSGKLVFTNQITLNEGINFISTSLPSLAAGAYVVQLVLPESTLESKFVY